MADKRIAEAAEKHLQTIENMFSNLQINSDNQALLIYGETRDDQDTLSLNYCFHGGDSLAVNMLITFFLHYPQVAIKIMAAMDSKEFRQELMAAIAKDIKNDLNDLLGDTQD